MTRTLIVLGVLTGLGSARADLSAKDTRAPNPPHYAGCERLGPTWKLDEMLEALWPDKAERVEVGTARVLAWEVTEAGSVRVERVLMWIGQKDRYWTLAHLYR